MPDPIELRECSGVEGSRSGGCDEGEAAAVRYPELHDGRVVIQDEASQRGASGWRCAFISARASQHQEISSASCSISMSQHEHSACHHARFLRLCQTRVESPSKA